MRAVTTPCYFAKDEAIVRLVFVRMRRDSGEHIAEPVIRIDLMLFARAQE